MSFSIKLTTGDRTFRGALYYGVTALELGTQMPLELELERHGDAFVGEVESAVAAGGHDDERAALKSGELAFAPDRNTLWIALGDASSNGGAAPSEAKLVPIGRLKGDLGPLRALGPKLHARIERD